MYPSLLEDGPLFLEVEEREKTGVLPR
jgi:hypothetical protein